MDHLDSVKVACDSHIQPVFVRNDMFEMTVHKKIDGQPINPAIYKDERKMNTLGAEVARLHQASRSYKAKDKENYLKFVRN